MHTGARRRRRAGGATSGPGRPGLRSPARCRPRGGRGRRGLEGRTGFQRTATRADRCAGARCRISAGCARRWAGEGTGAPRPRARQTGHGRTTGTPPAGMRRSAGSPRRIAKVELGQGLIGAHVVVERVEDPGHAGVEQRHRHPGDVGAHHDDDVEVKAGRVDDPPTDRWRQSARELWQCVARDAASRARSTSSSSRFGDPRRMGCRSRPARVDGPRRGPPRRPAAGPPRPSGGGVGRALPRSHRRAWPAHCGRARE